MAHMKGNMTLERQHGANEGQHDAHKRQNGAAPC